MVVATRIVRKIAATGIALALLVALAALVPTPVLAQQGGPQEVRQEIGPYEIGVLESPSNLSIGQVKFVVTVLDAATEQPVPNARVRLRTRHLEEGTEGWATALNTPRSPQYYEAVVTLDAPGTWQVNVEVDSPRGRVEVEAPPVHVPTGRQYTAGSLVFAGVSLVIILGAAYLWWSTRRERRKREADAQPT